MVTTRPETMTYPDQADLSGLDVSEGDPFAYKAEKSNVEGVFQARAGAAPQSRRTMMVQAVRFLRAEAGLFALVVAVHKTTRASQITLNMLMVAFLNVSYRKP